MDKPALLSEIQNGLLALSEMPQALTRLGSWTAATPGKSDTRLVCETVPPVVALAVAGMNDVLNRQGYTQAAWWNRIPLGAWVMMGILAICCSLLIGYGSHKRGARLYTIMPFLVSIAFSMIADIDSPRRGVIRVAPQNLISLSQSLHGPSAGF